jgi:hypothetical protein
LFAELRDRKLDLAPIVVFDPKLSRPAEVTDQGILRLSGLFETAPEPVVFNLAFVMDQGDWRLLGIRVSTQAAPGQPAAAAQSSTAKPTKPGTEKN